MAKDDAKDAPKDDGALVQVRILVDHGEYRCNTVATLDKAAAAALVKEGIADADPEAVKAAQAQA